MNPETLKLSLHNTDLIVMKTIAILFLLFSISQSHAKPSTKKKKHGADCPLTSNLRVTPGPYQNKLNSCQYPKRGTCRISNQFGHDNFGDVSPAFRAVLIHNGRPIFRFSNSFDLSFLGPHVKKVCNNKLTCLIRNVSPNVPVSVHISDGKNTSEVWSEPGTKLTADDVTKKLKKSGACAKIEYTFDSIVPQEKESAQGTSVD